MDVGFLFWLFFVGILIATLQDLKRREVDDWLNLLLLVFGFSYVVFKAIVENASSLIFHASFTLLVFFALAHLFYSARVFAGGDAKLLFAMSMFFIGAHFMETLVNAAIFVLLLMISGSLYGLGYSGWLYFGSYSRVNKEMKKEFYTIPNGALLLFGVLGILFGFFFSPIFGLFGVTLLFFPLLYSFARGVEHVCMHRVVSGSQLREGDWLVRDVRVGKKVIKARFEGLSSRDVFLMRALKRVPIKEGIPFVPAFLLAFLLYFFFRDELILRILGSI